MRVLSAPGRIGSSGTRRRVPRPGTRLPVLVLTALLALGGCAMNAQWQEASSTTVMQQDLDGLPYHPLVYHLDLCILAYQLYGQTLVWPFDPYYEELNNWEWDRTKFIARVRAWVETRGREQVADGVGFGGYRGPGMLAGFDDNPAHDPILYRYHRLHPWSHTITNAAGRWIEYRAPEEITGPVRDVHVSYRRTGGAPGDVRVHRVAPERRDSAPGARDVLIAFEGGTGDKGEAGQPASQSLMGFVLLRHTPAGGYDVHVAFRGSRSGSAGRALLQANWTESAEGNPDWITDLGYTYLAPEEGGAHVSTVGKVSRGFARSMDSILPQLVRSLERVAELEGGSSPDRIYVTGHSLGGALAQHFVSAVLLGDRYGPVGSGAAMPASLRSWPWEDIKLVTFGSPRAGDEEWARVLTSEYLDSEVFSTPVDPYDRSALPVAHPSIVPRLVDEERPAGFRVLLTQDPITTAKVIRGKHVGKSVYVDEPSTIKMLMPWFFSAHEPTEIRQLMLESLADSRIPPVAWRYREMTELNPGRDDGKRGTSEEFQKLKTAVDDYYRDNDLWFDHSGFEREFELHEAIRESR